MKKAMIFYLIYFSVFLTFIFSSFFLFSFEVENHRNSVLYRQVHDISFQYQEEEYPYFNVSFDDLSPYNSDTVGWIEIPDTNVSYPVVQGEDNSYYLSHSYDQTENSAGWIFMDYRNHSMMDDQVILYGHNRLDGSMFGSLKTLLSLDEKKYLFYNTIDQKLTYEIFSMYILDVDDFQSTNHFASELEHIDFLKNIQDRSLIPSSVLLSSHDKILTLYTCYGFGRERLILHAKLVQVKDVS